MVFKKLMKKFKNSLFSIFGENLENSVINYFDFLTLLYNIGFTNKNYYELIKKKNNVSISNDNNDIKYICYTDNSLKYKEKGTPKSKINKIKISFETELEFKMTKEAWKIITNNKEFNCDITGQSKNLILFIVNVYGIYNDGNIDNIYIKKELEKFKIELNVDDLHVSSKIYKYFHMFRNNAINNLLFRDKKRKIFEMIIEENDKNKKGCLNNTCDNNLSYTNIDKKNDIFLQNKKIKFKEKEKFKNENNRKGYTSFPSLTQSNDKRKINKTSKKYLNSSLKYINKYNIINTNINLGSNYINKSFISNNHLRKMFLNNPLEKDNDIQRKINGIKEARYQRKIKKIIKEKGIKINNIGNKYNNINYYNEKNI